MTAQEKWEEHTRRSKEIYAKCDATFALCEEHIQYLQDDTELKRTDKQIEEMRKRGDALIAESAALRKEARATMGIDDEFDRRLGLLEKKLQEK